MSDGPQGPGWWVASDGKWYPPQPAAGDQPTVPATPADAPTVQQPTYGDPTATTAFGQPAGQPAYGQPTAPPGAPSFPPSGPPAGPPTGPPAWGPGAGAAQTGGSGSGGKIALIIGVVVLVVLLLGGAVFALTRPKDDVVVQAPVATQAPTTPPPGTDASTSTTKKTTTTTDEETTTTRKTTSTTSSNSSTTAGPASDATRVAFDGVTAKWLPNSTATEREDLAKKICAAIDEEGVTAFLKDLTKTLPPGMDTVNQYQFVGAAIAAFCPAHLDEVQKIAGQ